MHEEPQKLTAAELNAQIGSNTPDVVKLIPRTVGEWIALGLLGVDSAGKLYLKTGTDGKLAVTEDKSSAIYTEVNYTRLAQTFDNAAPSLKSNADLSSAGKRLILVIPLTEAGGNIAATDILAGLAGYQAIVELLGIWSPQTDAASTWTIASEAGGGITGPTTFSIALTAYAITQFGAVAANQMGFPVSVFNTTDAKAIRISAAGLPAVGTTYYLLARGHYET